MEEKIHQLIKERNPWLLRDNFFQKNLLLIEKVS